MRDFMKLLIWQQGMILINKVYDIMLFLPVKQKIEIKTEQKMLAKFIDKVGS